MKEKKKPALAPSDKAADTIELKPAGSVVVSTTATPQPGAVNRNIHPRHALPIVPDRKPDAEDSE
jgi:hypothetical protein